MPQKITLCILIASGRERADTPAVQSERLELLLGSIFNSRLDYYFPSDVRVIVSDDYSDNTKAQEDCSKVCAEFGVSYIVNQKWRGPCGNYNNAVRACETEIIAMLGDDQFVTPGWWEYMEYFISKNPDLRWGMLGWSVVFSEDLVRVGYFDNRREFYTKKDKLWLFNYNSLPKEAIENKWCNWDRPRFRGCCSGTAFVIRKSLWMRFGGFFEEIYQFDEDYGDNVWNLTNSFCIQVPTPPILHYGGACEWPREKGAGDIRWRKAWEIRPFVPTKFEDRGKRASEIIEETGDVIKEVNFKPLNYTPWRKKLVLDLGCGKNKRHPEAIGLDMVGKPESDADVICNLGFEKIPFPDSSCKLVLAHDFLEHIPHQIWINTREGIRRLSPSIQLFNEVYRVLEKDGIFETATPYFHTSAPNSEVFQDPTHTSVWTPETFNYFSNSYDDKHDLYGHKSNFKIIKQFKDGAHLHCWLQAIK